MYTQNELFGVLKVPKCVLIQGKALYLFIGQVQDTIAALLASPSSPTREHSSFPGETRMSW